MKQRQISAFALKIMKVMGSRETISGWEVYNTATQLYKPGLTDIPSIIPHNVSFAETFIDYFDID